MGIFLSTAQRGQFNITILTPDDIFQQQKSDYFTGQGNVCQACQVYVLCDKD